MPAYYHIRPLVLVILDGWGIAPPGPGNAISQASLPNYKKLLLSSPHGQLLASGEAVGLPKGEPGNSEVGHLNIGAGRVVYEDVTRINMAIADGTFAKNSVLLKAIEHLKNFQSQAHLIGLVGGSTVHSNLEHLLSLIWVLKETGVKQILLHIFTDGRDSPPTSALTYVANLEIKLKSLGMGRIASVGGRYWGMDRDQRWERIEKAYQAISGKGLEHSESAQELIINSYKQKITDEFIAPTIILDSRSQPHQIRDKDCLIFFNFRPDRIREIAQAFVLDNFNHFDRSAIPNNLFFMTLTEYEKRLPVHVAYPPENVTLPLSRVISENGLHQLHIAETEKYAHVTYFLNGGREEPFAGEERILIPSPKVPTYDLKPEMSAIEITETFLKKFSSQIYDFLVVNFANPDMLGHTGKIVPTIKALETVDQCLGKIAREVDSYNAGLLITSDHGNAEQIINPSTGEPDTAHTTNPVPIILYHKSLTILHNKFLTQGALADVAPTILHMMGVTNPGAMTGRSLLEPY